MGISKIEENKLYTFEEYLALEDLAEERHEYHSGKIIAMAGGTGNHSLIMGRATTAITNAIDKADKNCSIFTADMKVKIEQYNKGLYPDISVVCGDIEYDNANKTVLNNPILLIEVLSKSTKDYDKGAKFEYYRSIPSFKEYMIVYQSIAKVQTWYKEAENCLPRFLGGRIGNAVGLDASITLHSIGCEVALKDIYKRIEGLERTTSDLDEIY